jgi:hypothetical protein
MKSIISLIDYLSTCGFKKESAHLVDLYEKYAGVEQLKDFQSKLTKNEATHFEFIRNDGSVETVHITQLLEHLNLILNIIYREDDQLEPHIQISPTRKNLDKKLREKLKEQKILADDLLRLNNTVEQAKPTVTEPFNSNGALIGINVAQRLKIGSIAGPSVCMGRLIGNKNSEPYIGMWYKNHCWAYPIINGNPKLVEVISYNNGKPTVNEKDKNDANSIAKMWTKEAIEFSKNIDVGTESAANILSTKLTMLEWEIQTLRIGVSYLSQIRNEHFDVSYSRNNERANGYRSNGYTHLVLDNNRKYKPLFEYAKIMGYDLDTTYLDDEGRPKYRIEIDYDMDQSDMPTLHKYDNKYEIDYSRLSNIVCKKFIEDALDYFGLNHNTVGSIELLSISH